MVWFRQSKTGCNRTATVIGLIGISVITYMSGICPSRASDHLDTPSVIADPRSDIGDVYAGLTRDGLCHCVLEPEFRVPLTQWHTRSATLRSRTGETECLDQTAKMPQHPRYATPFSSRQWPVYLHLPHRLSRCLPVFARVRRKRIH